MSKTEDNLKNAIINESLARNKYTYFAEIARKEGYHYVAKILDETADNEKFHAMEEFKLAYKKTNTASNLKDAIEGEDYETSEMYPQFALEAEIEGHKKAAILFTQIAKIERHHRDRFKKLLQLVESGTVFKREHPIKWKCSVCGYTHDGYEPPNRCPYCKKPKEYYEPANLDV